MMKKTFLGALLMLTWSAAVAGDFWFTFPNVARQAQTNRPFYLYPEIVTQGTRDRLVRRTDANGGVGVTNIFGGRYRGELIGVYTVTTNWYSFPETNGFDYATNWVLNPLLYAGISVYSTASADARFYPLTSNPSNYLTSASGIGGALTNNEARATALTNQANALAGTLSSTNLSQTYTVVAAQGVDSSGSITGMTITANSDLFVQGPGLFKGGLHVANGNASGIFVGKGTGLTNAAGHSFVATNENRAVVFTNPAAPSTAWSGVRDVKIFGNLGVVPKSGLAGSSDPMGFYTGSYWPEGTASGVPNMAIYFLTPSEYGNADYGTYHDGYVLGAGRNIGTGETNVNFNVGKGWMEFDVADNAKMILHNNGGVSIAGPTSAAHPNWSAAVPSRGPGPGSLSVQTNITSQFGRFIGNGLGLTNVPSTNVIYASQAGCRLDSNLAAGGGTSDSVAIQKALDLATNGPLEFVQNGVSLISTCLVIHSNTKLRINPGCGYYLADNSHCSMLINDWTTNLNPNVWTTNVQIQGGVFNCNNANQGHYHSNFVNTFSTGMTICGFGTWQIRGVEVRNSPSYGWFIINGSDLSFEDNQARFPYGTVNNDGVDFSGSMTNVVVRHFTHDGGDDTLNFGTDGLWQAFWTNSPLRTPGAGYMKNFLAEDIYSLNVSGGVRFHGVGTSNAVIENIFLNRVSMAGTFKSGETFIKQLTVNDLTRNISSAEALDNQGFPHFMDFSGYRIGQLTLNNVLVRDPWNGEELFNDYFLVVSDLNTNVVVNGLNFDSVYNNGPNGTGLIGITQVAGGTATPHLIVNGTMNRNASPIVNGAGGNGSVAINGALIIGGGAATAGTFNSITNIGVLVVP